MLSGGSASACHSGKDHFDQRNSVRPIMTTEAAGTAIDRRGFDRQGAEFQVLVAMLNDLTTLSIPATEAVG